jgi:hypothetical protein
MEGGGFCCQVPPNPACRSLTRQDFKIGIPNCVTQPGQPEHSCRLQLWIGPITAEPCRAKVRPLRPRRSCFAPIAGISNQRSAIKNYSVRSLASDYCPPNWWRRRVLPPGPIGLLRRPFIAIAGLRRHTQYRGKRLRKKERRALSVEITPRRRVPVTPQAADRRSPRGRRTAHRGNSHKAFGPATAAGLSLRPCPRRFLPPLPVHPRKRPLCSSFSLPSR